MEFFLKNYLNQLLGTESGKEWPVVGNLHFILQPEQDFKFNSRENSGAYCSPYNGNRVQNVSLQAVSLK